MIGAATLVIVAALALPTHQVGLSKGTWTQDGNVVDAEIVFSKNETTTLGQDTLQGVKVDVDGAACAPELVGESATEEDGHAVRLKFTCGHAGRITVELAPLLSTLAAGHRHLGKAISTAGEQDVLAFSGATAFSFGEQASVASYLWIGVEHIVLGFDHLVFLFGVILIGARLRALIGVITAFTLAHSITLGLAVLGVYQPPGEIIEPLIAVSIAYVGIENFFVKDANKRWRITAPFGLIHGFGFAGALAEVGIPAGKAPAVLFLFNLGVELGQLAVLALVLPILIALRKRGVLNDKVTKVLSLVVVALGLFWFVERVFLG